MQNVVNDHQKAAGDMPSLAGMRAYVLAALCLAIALGIRSALDPLWGDRYPYMIFFVAVFVFIQLGRIGPFVFTLLIGFLLGDWFFVAPRHSLCIASEGNKINTALYFLISFLMLYFTERVRRALFREQAARKELHRHADALGESRARFQHLFARSPAPTWVEDWAALKQWLEDLRGQGVADPSVFLDDHPERLREALGLLRVLDVNEAAVRLTGVSSKAELAASLPKLFTDTTHQTFMAGLSTLWKNECHIEHEANVLRLDGRRLDLIVFIDVPRRGARQELDFGNVIVTAIDITERKLAEQRLRAQEEHFRSLIEHSNDVISIVDEEGFIRYQGPSVIQVLGYSAEEMVGRNEFEFVHPEDHAAVRQVMKQTRQSGDPSGRVVFRHRHKDGSWRVVETSGSLLAPEGQESKRRFVVNLRDITERRRLEEAHAQLAAIVESSDDAIIGKSLDGTIVSWNAGAERLYGYTATEALGSSMGILAGPDCGDEMVPLLKRAGRGEHIAHFETIRRAKDGRMVEVSLSISPVHGHAGQIVAASTIARDITERKQAEREREELVQQLQAALAEVKTLSGILPICMGCKRIRDDAGYWSQIESYIKQHSNANFSHCLCPECGRKLYPEVFGDRPDA